MRRILCAALLSIGVATALTAQATPPQNRFGIGVSLSPLTFVGDPDAGNFQFAQTLIQVPIRNGAMLFEPEFGYSRTTTTEDGGGGSQENRISASRFGIGILMETGEREQLRPYIGARTGLVRGSQKFTSPFSTAELKLSGWYIGAVAGAQHYFTTHFSLGGEVQLINFSSDVDPSSGGGFSGSMSSLSTQGVMTLRWYF